VRRLCMWSSRPRCFMDLSPNDTRFFSCVVCRCAHDNVSSHFLRWWIYSRLRVHHHESFQFQVLWILRTACESPHSVSTLFLVSRSERGVRVAGAIRTHARDRSAILSYISLQHSTPYAQIITDLIGITTLSNHRRGAS
jgi:hypothetical protein